MAASGEPSTLGEWLGKVTLFPKGRVKSLIRGGHVEVEGSVENDRSRVLEQDDVVVVSLTRDFVLSGHAAYTNTDDNHSSLDPNSGYNDGLNFANADAFLSSSSSSSSSSTPAVEFPVSISLSFPHSTFIDFASNPLNAVMLPKNVIGYVFPSRAISVCGLGGNPEVDGPEGEPETCSVCMDDLAVTDHVGDGSLTRLSVCGWKHYFHADCISRWIEFGAQKCPVCSAICGTLIGNMPGGTFTVQREPDMSVAGNEDVGTIVISYSFPNGIQGDNHYHPGRPYYGTGRTAYLPDTPEGIEVLGLLRLAFIRRVMFTVGTSVTTGAEDCVVWAGIHAKTNTAGGATSFGYPDPTYFDRVKAELADRGIYPSDLDGMDESEYFENVRLD